MQTNGKTYLVFDEFLIYFPPPARLSKSTA